ncbi:MAG: 50S ribosomal protein L17 [Candidatus Harrisonbacteria bacterium CG10_big_fil_rev_8_21_14_0_10_49_15]|uniref:50S ribosomal protein L17 n=1 Tax=Candidatus Harrisonbacteria bacterium CG10_big_fil_rev_8_21_14_0_10_49_15 TaxID=1974587 RepID=A0A2H0UJR1_9BACT|nr:MAG: 50S ribosomal protein L17 [Candidatus Harrisonbacteria bacterium CG10_big_fil_rev_8_21_14_0_10_49_15]
MPATRKFGRKKGQRVAFRKSLAANLITRERMTTTVARAKEIRPVVERYVTLAKKGDLAKLRILMAKLPTKAAYKVFHEIAPRYKERPGGYLRITKTAKTRKRDGAETAVIEFV